MPRVAYSEEERERIRVALVRVGLDLMTKQGIQHTTVEQIYRRVGISRTFFYSFFPTKEDLIVETLYLQQPKIVAYARKLMADPALSWRDGVRQFLHACCYGEKNGIAVLTIEEQQLIFKRLSKESYQMFREKQARLFGTILESFGIRANRANISLFTNLSLTVLFSEDACDTINTLIPFCANALKIRKFTPITPTIPRPVTVIKLVSLMDEIPLMALEPELTSCFMIVPSP